jgi:Putative peptidoglycan binding domain
MKLHHLISAAIATVIAATPAVAMAKDDHHSHHHDDHHYNGHYYGGGRYYGPRVGFSFGYPGYYSPYGYGYGYGYGYPYYRPSIGLSFSNYSYPGRVYRGGYYGDSLAVDVQSELRRRGYYRGAIDGDIGPASRAAIRAYQYDHGLSGTGRIDSRLLRSLGIG